MTGWCDTSGPDLTLHIQQADQGFHLTHSGISLVRKSLIGRVWTQSLQVIRSTPYSGSLCQKWLLFLGAKVFEQKKKELLQVLKFRSQIAYLIGAIWIFEVFTVLDSFLLTGAWVKTHVMWSNIMKQNRPMAPWIMNCHVCIPNRETKNIANHRYIAD